MASFHNSQMLGDVLGSLIKDLGIGKKLDEVRTVEAWAHLAGPRINAITERAWVHGGRLYVRIASAAWRHELARSRGVWRDRLNGQLGAELVDEIVFR